MEVSGGSRDLRAPPALAAGFRDRDAYRHDDAPDPIRSRADFRLLMMDLDMPTEPFAASGR